MLCWPTGPNLGFTWFYHVLPMLKWFLLYMWHHLTIPFPTFTTKQSNTWTKVAKISFIPGTSHKKCVIWLTVPGRCWGVLPIISWWCFLRSFFPCSFQMSRKAMIQEDVQLIHIAQDEDLLEAIDTENQGISAAISGIPKYQVRVRPITSQPLLLDAVRGFRLSNVWKLLFPCALVCVGKHGNVRISTAGC